MSRPTTTVLLVVTFLVLTNVAAGKGPQSATLTGPGIDQPIELMDAVDWPISCDGACPPDPMVGLMEQTGIWYGVGDLPVPIDPPDGELGDSHVLTWSRGGSPEEGIHQYIYLDAQDGPVIHTPAQKGLEGWGTGAVGWFRASDGLRDTLASLGALDPDVEVGGSVALIVRGPFKWIAFSGAGVLLFMWVYWRFRPRASPNDRATSVIQKRVRPQ